ncbi:MAG: response regulator, partial [Planctomycetes bacterium]|nr:response regulator [Planctomycetota bacterium]
VEEASNGQMAVEMVRERAGDFDLVLLDRLMPHMMGDEAAKQIHGIKADLPIVILSGYVDLETRNQLRTCGVVECLQKPVGINDLVSTIDHILKRRQRTVTR